MKLKLKLWHYLFIIHNAFTWIALSFGLAGCFLGTSLNAQIEQPRHVYCAEDFPKAIAQAAEQHLPVLVVRTNLESTCGWTHRFTNQMFSEYRGVAVIVVLQTSTWDNAPPHVKSTVHSDKLGRTIPRIGLFNGQLDETLLAVPYTELKDNNSEITHQLRRAMRRYTEEARTAASAIPVGPEAPAQRIWTDNQGRTIEATMRRFNHESVRIQRNDGMFFTIPLETLSDPDREYLIVYRDSRYFGNL